MYFAQIQLQDGLKELFEALDRGKGKVTGIVDKASKRGREGEGGGGPWTP